jgi:hemoglobin/transferrin/lactoferrin receptor protein
VEAPAIERDEARAPAAPDAQAPPDAPDAPDAPAAPDAARIAEPAGNADERPALVPSFLDSITVTGSRGERETLAEPWIVEILTAEDLRHRRKAANFADAFEELPAIWVQKTAHGQGSPFIRGFTGAHNLMLVDGVRFNSSVLREGPNQYWATLDPLSARKLEIVKGPSSVLYGSDAVGGAANLLTRDPRVNAGGGLVSRRQVHARAGEADGAILGRVEVEGASGPTIGYLIGATVGDFGDVRAGGTTGRVVGSGYDEKGADAKLVWAPGPRQAVTILHQSFQQEDVPRTETTVLSKPFRGTLAGTDLRRDEDQKRSLSYVRYDWSGGEDSFLDLVEATVSVQTATEQTLRVRGNGRSDRSGFDLDTLGAQVLLRSTTPVGLLTYGIDSYSDDVDSFRTDYDADGSLRSRSVQGPVADDASYETFELFVRDEVRLADDRLRVALGARLSRHSLDAQRVEDPRTGKPFSLDDSWSGAVGSLHLSWKPQGDRRWSVFGSAAQAFRAPNLADLTRYEADSLFEVPSPGLEPERFLNLEVGAKRSSSRLALEGAIFHTIIDGLITRSPTGELVDGTPAVHKSNVGDGFVRGVEGAARFRPAERLELWANVTFMEGEVDDFLFASASAREIRGPVSRLVPWMTNAGVRWESRSAPFWVEAHATALGEADQLSLRDQADRRRIPPQGTPGFVVFGLRSAWRVEAAGLEVSAGLENLLDEDYRIHGSGQNRPGRNLVVALTWDG